MITKDRLQQIAESREITADMVNDITTASREMGIPFMPQRACKDCYKDQAIILWRTIVEQETMKDKKRKYVLRAGVDVIWRGIRINAATITDELAQDYIKRGFSKHFFCKIDGKKYDYYANIK